MTDRDGVVICSDRDNCSACIVLQVVAPSSLERNLLWTHMLFQHNNARVNTRTLVELFLGRKSHMHRSLTYPSLCTDDVHIHNVLDLTSKVADDQRLALVQTIQNLDLQGTCMLQNVTNVSNLIVIISQKIQCLDFIPM